MKRLLLIAVLLAGCGTGIHGKTEPLTYSQPNGSVCHPRTPPSMGECVAQHFGITPTPNNSKSVQTFGAPCLDLSQWQGYYPNFAGLSCVILQANFGGSTEPSIYSQRFLRVAST